MPSHWFKSVILMIKLAYYTVALDTILKLQLQEHRKEVDNVFDALMYFNSGVQKWVGLIRANLGSSNAVDKFSCLVL